MERIDDTTLISGNSLVHVGLYFTLYRLDPPQFSDFGTTIGKF